MTEKRTLAGAYQKIEAHEDLCAERYRNINASITDLKGLLKWALGFVASTCVAVIGYLGHQVISG